MWIWLLPQIRLTNRTDGWVWETFPIDPPRLSGSIRLTVVSAYVRADSRVTTDVNEVMVYGTIPGDIFRKTKIRSNLNQ